MRAFLLAVLGLSAATAAFFAAFPPFEVIGPELLGLADGRTPVSGWQRSRSGVSVGADGTIHLESHDPREYVHLTREIPAVPGQLILVSAGLRTLDVIPGAKGWQRARLVVAQFDSDGTAMYFVNHTVESLDGTRPWRTYEKVFPIEDRAAVIRVALQLPRAAGVLEARTLRAWRAQENPAFRATRMGLMVLWASICLWGLTLALPVFRARPRLWIPIAMLGAATLVGTLTPQEIKKHLDRNLPPFLHAVDREIAPLDARPLASTPTKRAPEFNLYKVGHFTFFAALGVAVRRLTAGRRTSPDAIGALFVFAIATEALQSFSPGRQAHLADVAIDMAGVVAGLLLASRYAWISSRLRRS